MQDLKKSFKGFKMIPTKYQHANTDHVMAVDFTEIKSLYSFCNIIFAEVDNEERVSCFSREVSKKYTKFIDQKLSTIAARDWSSGKLFDLKKNTAIADWDVPLTIKILWYSQIPLRLT